MEQSKAEKHSPGRKTKPPGARVAAGHSGGSLVNRTNIGTPRVRERLKIDLETGEILEQFDPTLKYQIQAVARLALGVFDENTPYERGHRIRICCRHPIPHHQVTIRQKDEARPYFGGVMSCGSVWVCPVCASKIQQVRAAELRQAIDNWIEQGGTVLMGVYTVPHSRHDELEKLLGNFNQALRLLVMGKSWKLLKQRYGIAGQVKALEVTWSTANGWHPHAHVLYFIESVVINQQALEDQLFKLWQSAAGRTGFTGLNRSIFRLQDAAKAHAYVTKLNTEYSWGAEDELVRSHSKTGKGSSFTPFDFLRSYLVKPDEGQRLALFAEFAMAFKGRNQLAWSHGFKKQLLGSEGLSDAAIAASLGQVDTTLGQLTLEQWQYIRRWNMQGTVLQVASLHGMAGVMHLLSEGGQHSAGGRGPLQAPVIVAGLYPEAN